MQKGDIVQLHGDEWMIVDIAPAPELADMVAVILEEEGFTVERMGDTMGDEVLRALGAQYMGSSYLLVPSAQGEDALKLIEEVVMDYEGEDAQAMLEELALAAEGEDIDLEDDES